jgi:hypothetical protein
MPLPMKRNSKLKKIVLITVVALVLLMLLMRINILPPLGNIFYRQPLKIDNTNILIKEIKPLAQLVTVTAYQELVIDSIKYHRPGLTDQLIRMTTPVPTSTQYDELVLIARGRVMGGTDLEKLRKEDLYVKNDSASVLLPASSVLDVIINPSDFETFSEKGVWESEEVTILKESARSILEKQAIQQGLLQKADLQAILIMKNFLQAAGFKKIQVAIR